MSVVEKLLDTAAADLDLLAANAAKSDRQGISRDIDFLLIAPDREKAEVVSSFVADNRYGAATIEPEPDSTRWRVQVVVHAPATEQVVCSISGLMTCLAELFDLEYDGWGCVLQQERRSLTGDAAQQGVAPDDRSPSAPARR